MRKIKLNPTPKAARIRDAHVAPLNYYVDKLRAERRSFVPYFDPDDGGTDAEILLVLQRPGPKATDFISIDNPDQTARNFREVERAAGIDRKKVCHWNIIPWYASAKAEMPAAERAIGRERLGELLRTELSRITTIVAIGKVAQKGLAKMQTPGVLLLSGPHPSPQNFNTRPKERRRLIRVLRKAAASTPARRGPRRPTANAPPVAAKLIAAKATRPAPGTAPDGPSAPGEADRRDARLLPPPCLLRKRGAQRPDDRTPPGAEPETGSQIAGKVSGQPAEPARQSPA